MAGSGALHALYFVLLQRGYRDGDLSLVYPLARGTGPLLSTLAAIVVFAERPSALALAGGAIIVAAVLSLARAGGPDAGGGSGDRGRGARRFARAHGRRDRGVHAVGQAGGRPARPVADRLLLGHERRRDARC